MQSYYSLLVDLKQQPCLVVGGGQVAERKVALLLECEAQVLVVSPDVTPKLARLQEQGVIQVFKRAYHPDDVRQAFFVLACTDSIQLNRRIGSDAKKAGKLVNAASPGDAGNVVLPAILRRGRLTLSVSTMGASPSLAQSIRDQWEQEYGAEYEQYMEFLAEFRELVHKYVSDPRERRKWLKDMVNWGGLEAIRNGRLDRLVERKRSELTDLSSGAASDQQNA